MAWQPELDTVALLGVLTTHRVDFVVIGGIAAVLRGSPTMTHDLDVCFETTDDNRERLAAALTELEARLAGIQQDVPFVPDARTLRSISFLPLVTPAGRLDVLAAPDGFPGYDALRAASDIVDVGPFGVRVASLPHLVSMKRAAGRPKDLAAITELEAIARIRAERGL